MRGTVSKRLRKLVWDKKEKREEKLYRDKENGIIIAEPRRQYYQELKKELKRAYKTGEKS